jgi:hypothetical protein
MAKNDLLSAVKESRHDDITLIGAAVLTLVLATPAMATHCHHHPYHYFHDYSVYNHFARRNSFH